MELLLVTNAIKRLNRYTRVDLVLPYLPYSRQDRACVEGEAFSLKVFADIINDQMYDRVITLDAHSNVAGGVFNDFYNVSQKDILGVVENTPFKLTNGAVVVIPDEGAAKKATDVAAAFGLETVLATKVRDMNTGAILRTEVFSSDLSGKTAVIIDDICDGGRTFIELAKVLKAKNAKEVFLWVTHGIFSKGTAVLGPHIDRVFTTNSFSCKYDGGPRIDHNNVEDILTELGYME
jgi:ribose-phosphate pyrophosphokinase